MSPKDRLGALEERIRARASELGLARVGFSPARRAPRADAFHRWLSQGYAGEMAYLEHRPDSRANVTIRSPWARTIVSAALHYAPAPMPEAAPLRGGLLGFVSAYAHGPDYHGVLKTRLEQLAGFLRTEGQGRAETRCLVDTSAILERDHAAASGVGWTGKNAMTIDPESGSYFFLGEILTDLELDPGTEMEDLCGGCTRCLEACPTQAIVDSRVVDARRCISYLTIELKGAIPSPLRASVGDHLFGCDVCQQVCPWNRQACASGSVSSADSPSSALEATTLAGVVAMGEREFAERFRGTALSRAKRRGVVRNALIVAANTEDGAALHAARAIVEDEDPMLRETATWALARHES